MSVGTNLYSYIGLELLKFHNGLLSSKSAFLKQALQVKVHADLKLVPRAKTSWAPDRPYVAHFARSDGLQGCDTYTPRM